MAILTISREIGSEGLATGKAVAEKIGYEFCDKERILHDLKADGNSWAKEGKDWDEQNPTIWERYDWQYQGFIALAQSHILECALSNNVVIMGRGGNFLLDGIPHVLRTRIVAPMDARVEKVTSDEVCADFVCVDKETARSHLQKADRDSEHLMRAIFDKDWNDPRAYDVTFNMCFLDIDEVADALVSLLAKRDRYKDARADTLLSRRALAAKIKAAVLTDARFAVPTLEVLPTDEAIVMKGVVHSVSEHKLIEEKAKEIAGAVAVKCELHYR